ncbi:SUMO-interacting motif-containing protein 1 [Megalops cyprinoides]|uniref:SUMO-interacting motif-containing protein 1 n=1 Tax=Megalops cyprinoides TaxID=118141 RepID=UPI001864C31A|nr:SUMO-interacting motif-containing protein 1 [Megalops cyprinoides]
MEDVILVSSGSEDESDVEFLGVYEDRKEESKAFVREWPSFPQALIDLTDCGCAPSQRRCQRKGTGSPVVVVDLSDSSLPDGLDTDPLSPAPGLAGEQEVKQTTLEAPNALILEFCQRSPGHSTSQSCGRSLESSGDISESYKRSLSLISGEPLETQNTQDCPSNVTLKLSWKSSCASVPEILGKQKRNTESPCAFILKVARSPPRLDINEQIPETARDSFNASNIPKEPSASSISHVATSKRGNDAENSLQDTDSKLRPFPTEIQQPKSEKEENLEPNSVGDDFPDYPFNTSPISDYSPYYCPSEIDPVLFSDSNSSMHESQQDNISTYSLSPAPSSPSQDLIQNPLQEKLHYTSSAPRGPPKTEAWSGGDVDHVLQLSSGVCPRSPEPSQQLSQPSPSNGSRGGSVSPTSTEILAGDSPDWLVDDAELPLESPPSPPSLPSSPFPPRSREMGGDTCEAGPGAESPTPSTGPEDSEEEEELSGCEAALSSRDVSRRDRRYVSKTQYKKLRQLMGRPLPNMAGDDGDDDDDSEEEEEVGPAQPLGRQSLSLVNSTMEERYPEGTLQLLSDFLHPRIYPPASVTSHLIRDILLNPEYDLPLVTEAFGLLMKIQKHHPATQATVQWDWELLISVMDPQSPERRRPSTIVRMLLQYGLQTLEDDFRLSLRRLHCSIVAATLSCSRQFVHVRGVISWLVAAVRNSTGDPEGDASEAREREENLRIVSILQRMLAMAMEVDRSPTISCNKLSHELLQTLSTMQHRHHRLLLLQTLESRLLQCKLLKLLLEDRCTERTTLPMSLSLLLHFLQSSTPSPDPTDDSERWRKWSELIQLLWMLLLSYEEVTEGHLRLPITERAGCSRAPIRTMYDQITSEAVQEAADFFLFRVSADLGHALPPQLQDSFSLLQNHLHGTCQH